MSKPSLYIHHRYGTSPTPESMPCADAKHTLIKVLSKVSISSSVHDSPFLRNVVFMDGQSHSLHFRSGRDRKRQGEALRDNLYLRRWYICTTYAFRCIRLTSLSRDEDCACPFNYVHSTCSIGISRCIVVRSLCRGQESYSNNDEDQV